MQVTYFNITPHLAGILNLNRPSLTDKSEASPSNAVGLPFASYATAACWVESEVFNAMINVLPSNERENAYVPSADHNLLKLPHLRAVFCFRNAITCLA